MKNKAQSKKRIGSIISTIIYIVLILLLLFTLVMNLNRRENEITSFFGFSFAVVQTGSMTEGGFNVGDMVVIKNVDTNTIRRGDIIVFYQYYDDPYDREVNKKVANGLLQPISDEDLNAGNYPPKLNVPLGLGTVENAKMLNKKLIFHRVIEIYVDENGIRYFMTKGDSNDGADLCIRDEFVGAQYAGSGKVVQSILNFIQTPLGLAVVIILPIALTVLLEIFVFGKEVKASRYVDKLLARKMRIGEVDTKKYKIAEFFSEPEKVFLYDICLDADKADVAIVLWDENVEGCLNIYEKDRDAYYSAFAEGFSKNDKKKLAELKIKADIIKQNPEISDEEATLQANKVLKEQKENKND